MNDVPDRAPDLRRSVLPACLALVVSTLLVLTVAPAATAGPVGRGAMTAASTEAQQRVDEAAAVYAESRKDVEALSAQAERLDDSATQAEEHATELRTQVADEEGGVLHALGDFLSPGESDVDKAADAAENAADARRLADQVQDALDDAIAQVERDRQEWEKAQARLERIESTWSAQQVVEAAIERSQPPADYAADPAQERRDRSALDAWIGYLRDLGRTGVTPPTAKAMADPAKLADGLEPLQAWGVGEIPGLAGARLPDGRAVTVLPTETIRAVADAFHRLGSADDADAGASAYACGGLVANAWSASRAVLPAEVQDQLTALPAVPRDAVQVGDLVALGNKRDGLGESGVYVGNGLAIVADPTTGVAGVREVAARDLLAARRPSLAVSGAAPAASQPTTEQAATKTIDLPSFGACVASAAPVSAAPVTGSGPLVLPIAAGTYHLSAGFAEAGGLWSSGSHTGQDFAAPIGTAVTAAGAGTVTIEHPSWAGNLVRIDHGGGVETLYAHLSRVDVVSGQTVAAGDQVGAVGSEGNSTGPHLHFEVRLDGTAVDPVQVVHVPEAPQPTYPNGEMPDSALCAATPDGVQHLACDAAVAYRLMGAQFEQDTGETMCITDSYRSLSGQEAVHVLKPSITAQPGTSIHGFGRAVDLCGGIESFSSSEHAWMEEHGPSFGWIHPSWAAAGGSRPEPWHFEYEG
jgi:murein DD-endopeptidase MepM/ murein hydrolase activator NlpD